MHYFVDGYNMLFRLMHDEKNLQTHREQVISLLNQKAAALDLNITLVFDAHYQPGDLSRGHLGQLEIAFTDEGETADEYILQELKKGSNPRQQTVVTSDKRLAWHVRSRGAHTKTIEEFLNWLHKAYQNRRKRIKKPAPTPKRVFKTVTKTAPSPDAPAEDCFSYYESVFEAEFQELIKVEEVRKEQRAAAKPPKKRRKAKQMKPPEDSLISDEERWLKIFEDKLRGD